MDEPPQDRLVAFISYARGGDGQAFARRLRGWLLERGVTPSMDEDLMLGEPLAAAVAQRMQGADLLLYVMTPESVDENHSWCQRELELAHDEGRPVVPLRADPDAEPPLLARNLVHIWLTGRRAVDGWAELERKLAELAGPDGRRHRLLLQLRAQQERQRRAGEASTLYRETIADLERQLAELATPPAAVPGVAVTTPRSQGAVPAAPPAQSGEPPAVPPGRFQDRGAEIEELERRLSDASVRLVTLSGRAGIGKTAIISRLWERVHDGTSPLATDGPGLVYRSARDFRPVAADDLLRALARMAPDPAVGARALDEVSLPMPWVERLLTVLAALGGRRVVVALDTVEDLLDDEQELAEPALRELLEQLVARTGHRVVVLLVGRVTPAPLLRRHGSAAFSRDLEAGLPAEYVLDLLRAAEPPDAPNWAAQPLDQIAWLQQLTDGSPRALEIAHGIGREGPLSAVLDLLQGKGRADPVQFLFAWAFGLLGRQQRLVVQALAVFGRPVTAGSVEELLRDFEPHLEVKPTLVGLRERGLVRCDGDSWYVPPAPEGLHALGTLPEGSVEDRRTTPLPYTDIGLFHRAADLLASYPTHRRPLRVEDLAVPLAEALLRVRGRDHEAALTRMAELQREYLSGWGYSAALVPPLSRMLQDDDLPRALRVDAMNLLGLCYLEQEEFEQAEHVFRHAVELAGDVRLIRQRVKVVQHVAAAQAGAGLRHDAGRTYRQALRLALLVPRPERLSWTLEGWAMACAWEGRFTPALRRFRWAHRMLGRSSKRSKQVDRIRVLLNTAWVLGRLGYREAARAHLKQASAMAVDLHDDGLEGLCQLHLAELLLDEQRPAQAVSLAENAARIGLRHGNRSLCRDAKEVATLAYLCMGATDRAAEAVTVARRHVCSVQGLSLAALVYYRSGNSAAARHTFRECRIAIDRVCRWPGERDYQLLDARGLTNCGLALLGEAEALPRSLASYRAARALTAAPGAVARVELMLGQLGNEEASDILGVVKRAALAPAPHLVK